MKVTYEARDDVLMLDQGDSAKAGTSLVGYSGTIVEFKNPRDSNTMVKPVAVLEILDFSKHLPLEEAGHYDADTDTRMFGNNLEPDAEYQAVENDDLVAYWKKFIFEKDKEDWFLVGVALRRATHHLGKIIARHPKLRNAK